MTEHEERRLLAAWLPWLRRLPAAQEVLDLAARVLEDDHA